MTRHSLMGVFFIFNSHQLMSVMVSPQWLTCIGMGGDENLRLLVGKT